MVLHMLPENNLVKDPPKTFIFKTSIGEPLLVFSSFPRSRFREIQETRYLENQKVENDNGKL